MACNSRRLWIVLVCLLATLACGQSKSGTPTPAATNAPLVATAEGELSGEQQPTAEAADGPLATPTLSAGEAVAFYNLPQAVLVENTGLYASPNGPQLVVSVEIPAGTTVYVMGRNGTQSHLRVVWNTGVGWVPTSFTNYNAQQALLDALPVFQREPPACVTPATTQFNLTSEWTYDGAGLQRVAVIVDLFRSRYGDFPQSSLALKVNGQPVEESRREIVEHGQFSLKDVVFKPGNYLQSGDRLGYDLQTSSDEPLAFVATIFLVPEGCVWETD